MTEQQRHDRELLLRRCAMGSRRGKARGSFFDQRGAVIAALDEGLIEKRGDYQLTDAGRYALDAMRGGGR